MSLSDAPKNLSTRQEADDFDDKATAVDHTPTVDKEKVDTGKVEESEPVGASSEDPSQYPSGGKLALITLGLCLATFVVSTSHCAMPRIVFDASQ